MTGWQTLLYKETLRFWKVGFQTVAAPVLTALLYLLIFGHVLRGPVAEYPDISYTSFLIPGLVMMSVLQNAFANSSSSLIQSKITGNLVFVLLAPLSHWEMFSAYVLAGMLRGLAVGFGVFVITAWFAHLSFVAPLWILVFALLGSYRRALIETECAYGCPIGSLALELHDADPIVRKHLADNFTGWIDAVEGCLAAAATRFPPETDLRGLAEMALHVMEGGVMQARTYRDIDFFDRAVAQFRLHVDALTQKEAVQ